MGTKINRRKFIAASAGATLGFGLFGLIPRGASAKGDSSSGHSKSSALTLPVGQLRESYDVLIVGSGYGGSILSARLMAHPGLSLCLLERGREWHPGEFPTELADLTKALRTPVNHFGLIDITAQMGADVDIIAGNGLGGTSLINAAIASRPEKIVFEQNEWPDEIRALAQLGDEHEGPLWEYYERVERVLKPKVDPRANDIVKIQRYKGALHRLGYSHENLPLNITHGSPGQAKNEFGVTQGSCVRCGDCCSGCNTGAKNTLATNYLPLAKGGGAEIFTGIEVTKIAKNAHGYLVSYTYHGKEDAQKHGTIQTKVLVLSAGSMGTTEILLRSKHQNRLSLSSKLGTRLSANGDVLSCSYNGDYALDVIDYGNTAHPRKGQSFRAGQALMSASKFRGSAPDLSDHFLLLDGPVPNVFAETLAKALAAVAAPTTLLNVEKSLRRGMDVVSIHPPDRGALNHTLLMLACGHDSFSGKYTYNGDGRPKAIWPNVTEEVSFEKIRAEMKKVNDQLGGTFIANPRSEVFGGGKVQITHPLGGCPMGNTPDDGVVNHLGQVFDADGNIHQGLFVADASMIPRSLGATPLMTVSALSERIADSLLVELPRLLA